MRTRFTAALVAILVLAIAAPALADAHESQVTVVHGVPDLTVDVWVNGDPFLEGFEPDTVTDEQTLPEDTYEIEIYAAGSDPEDEDPAIADSVDLPAGVNASIVAHLDADGTPTLSVFVNDTDEIADGESRLTARHVAAAPATDVRANEDALFEGVENGDEGTVDVPADTYAADVTLAGEDDAVIGPVDLTLEAGTHYLAYAVGSADDGNLDLLVQTIGGLGAAADADADDADDEPHSVPSGSGGLASDGGFAAWMALALAGGAALTVAGATRAVRQRN